MSTSRSDGDSEVPAPAPTRVSLPKAPASASAAVGAATTTTTAAAPAAPAPAVAATAPAVAAPLSVPQTVPQVPALQQSQQMQTGSQTAPQGSSGAVCEDAPACAYWKGKYGSSKFACSETNNRRDKCALMCDRCQTLGLTSRPRATEELQGTAPAGSFSCNFVVGDAVGGYEQYIGNYDADWECASAVMDMHPTANGAAFMANSSLCYAVFGMAASNGVSELTTCKFDGRTPLLKDVPAAKRMAAAGAASKASAS